MIKEIQEILNSEDSDKSKNEQLDNLRDRFIKEINEARAQITKRGKMCPICNLYYKPDDWQIIYKKVLKVVQQHPYKEENDIEYTAKPHRVFEEICPKGHKFEKVLE